MAGGMDWFRWHHGSVTDPKFGLIAKKAGARLGDVLAVWAFVLESASANETRGTVGAIDAESLEYLLGLDQGAAYRILDAMTQRGLLGVGGVVVSWDKRQPKREDDTAAERKRRQREREHELALAAVVTEQKSRTVTQSHADVTHGHDRREEKREEEKKDKDNHPTPRKRGSAGAVGFDVFWAAYPRKTARQVAEKAFERIAPSADLLDEIVSAVRAQSLWPTWTRDGGQYIPHAATWLNGRRWEDKPQSVVAAPMFETDKARAARLSVEAMTGGLVSIRPRTAAQQQEADDGRNFLALG